MLDIAVDSTVGERWEGDAVLAVCRFEGCGEIEPRGIASLDAALDAATAALRSKGRAVLEEPRVQQLRATFRSMPDLDPARYRPASESLLRRVLESGFFRISPLVDANNLLSVKLRLPLGIYDLARVPLSGWIYRLGRHGETYRTHSQQEKNAGGKLVLTDADGIFGSPVADSGRATIQETTRDVAVVAYLAKGMASEEPAIAVAEIASAFQGWFAPARAECWIVNRAEPLVSVAVPGA